MISIQSNASNNIPVISAKVSKYSGYLIFLNGLFLYLISLLINELGKYWIRARLALAIGNQTEWILVGLWNCLETSRGCGILFLFLLLVWCCWWCHAVTIDVVRFLMVSVGSAVHLGLFACNILIGDWSIVCWLFILVSLFKEKAKLN